MAGQFYTSLNALSASGFFFQSSYINSSNNALGMTSVTLNASLTTSQYTNQGLSAFDYDEMDAFAGAVFVYDSTTFLGFVCAAPTTVSSLGTDMPHLRNQPSNTAQGVCWLSQSFTNAAVQFSSLVMNRTNVAISYLNSDQTHRPNDLLVDILNTELFVLYALSGFSVDGAAANSRFAVRAVRLGNAASVVVFLLTGSSNPNTREAQTKYPLSGPTHDQSSMSDPRSYVDVGVDVSNNLYVAYHLYLSPSTWGVQVDLYQVVLAGNLVSGVNFIRNLISYQTLTVLPIMLVNRWGLNAYLFFHQPATFSLYRSGTFNMTVDLSSPSGTVVSASINQVDSGVALVLGSTAGLETWSQCSTGTPISHLFAPELLYSDPSHPELNFLAVSRAAISNNCTASGQGVFFGIPFLNDYRIKSN